MGLNNLPVTVNEQETGNGEHTTFVTQFLIYALRQFLTGQDMMSFQIVVSNRLTPHISLLRTVDGEVKINYIQILTLFL